MCQNASDLAAAKRRRLHARVGPHGEKYVFVFIAIDILFVVRLAVFRDNRPRCPRLFLAMV
jgi:hypothetical protein